MKYLLTPLFVVSVFALSVFGFQPLAHAQAELSIAIVDVEKVLNDSDAAKALNKKRADAREAFLTKLSKDEETLRSEGKALFEKRKELSEEEFAKQQRAYQEKLAGMSKLTQQNRRAFELASNVALQELQTELTKAVQSIASDKGYTLILSNRNVIVGAKSLDITDETIKQMNAQKIKIPFNVKK
ncbi:MAG: OmpH family outer membrane protein [Alphaproteobacteria bacterium]|nr:OmpH family outer membrane protein [Alphaproteobacteria bacterium]